MDEKLFSPFHAKIELMGHSVVAGEIVEMGDLIRVEIPADGNSPAHTRWFGKMAIYSITSVSEKIACVLAARYQLRPVSVYELPAPPAAPAEMVAFSRLTDDREIWDERRDEYRCRACESGDVTEGHQHARWCPRNPCAASHPGNQVPDDEED